jgi:hypothetical protein
MAAAKRERTGDLQVIDQKIAEAQEEMNKNSNFKDGIPYMAAKKRIDNLNASKVEYKKEMEEFTDLFETQKETEKELRDLSGVRDNKERKVLSINNQLEAIKVKKEALGGKKDNKSN